MNVSALFTAKTTRQSRPSDLASLRRRLDESRERAEKFRVEVEALERFQQNLIESAKRCGFDLESYAAELEGLAK